MSRDRAQTQQDFAIGVSVFLLAVLFVFAYLPSTLAMGDAVVEQRSYTADRLGSSLLTDLSDEGSAGELNATRTRTFFAGHENGADIEANYSVAGTTSVNVTLETLEGITVDDLGGGVGATAGKEYADQVGATSTRIVRLAGTRYRLVVRVW
ncbi:DUF7287 family protein [Haloplanus ruber]|uniref:Flagellin n=1 Tax=Haloplanus ruber TaxID=869892 RepID=A0ABD6CZU7_9EURY|nr:hypothetical protein [Haloplanus ruber]